MKILPMTIRHVREITEIEQECFSEPWSEKSFMEEMNNIQAIILAAVEEDKTVGFINARHIIDEVYINNIAVTKEYRRKHIAEALLLFLESTVQNEASFITLEVRKSNKPAQCLYKKLGYEIVGERKNFYREPIENAILMTKKFNKEVL